MTVDTSENGEAIAIIGMAGRFPGAMDTTEFWDNLCAGRETISVFTDEELIATGVSPDMLRDPRYVRSKGILGNVDKFDAAFFGFNPREAEILDPQHRMFLEEAWHALEDSGYDPAQTDARIGIWGGCGTTEYLFRCYGNAELMRDVSGIALLTSNDKDYLTTRTSYKLNLRGPSVNVQSACSTSLVAVTMATNAILNYECDMALAGGVSIRAPEIDGFIYEEGGILSPDGHCRTFDEQARGTVFSSGVGVVVLKRLSDAVRDRDHIYAVIRGAAVNNDGQVKIGFTAPSVDGQAEVAAAAIAMSGVDVEDISYIEAHGTATPLGDPIEVGALTKVFRNATDKQHFCAIGSVKTNIGHTDIAAGVAGLIKTSLSLEHRLLPPTLHYQRPNPKLHMEDGPFYVNTKLTEWTPTDGRPLRAAVSSFGVGGTNAHVVLEQAPVRAPSGASRRQQIVTVSARTDTALATLAGRVAAQVAGAEAEALADTAYSCNVGRRPMEWRRFAVGEHAAALAADLAGEDADAASLWLDADVPQPVFMFPGQGSQYVDMGRGLYAAEAVFRAEFDRCATLLQTHLELDLRTLIHPPEGEADAAAERLRQTALTQPALFAIEYATARLMMSWGVQPAAMIGHSIGEYVAACLAGVFSLADALALVALRGRLMQSLAPGAMLAVMLPEERVVPFLQPGVSVAAVNSPTVTVVAGAADAIAALQSVLEGEGIMANRLVTSHAFHSAMMDPVLAEFTAAVARTRRAAPSIPYVSNVTGTWITPEQVADPAYFAAHLRQAVRFAAGIATLEAHGKYLFLEVGPGRALQSAVRITAPDAAERGLFGTMRHPSQAEDDGALILTTLGELWARGTRIDWTAFYAEEARNRVRLPIYPFERESYLIESTQSSAPAAAPGSGPLLRVADLADWIYTPSWKGTADPRSLIDPARAAAAGTWVVFGDAMGLGERIAAKLTAEGRDVVQVEIGDRFARTGPRRFTIDPASREDHASLIGELRRANQIPNRILHLFNVTETASAVDLAGADAAENLAFYSPLHLGQALGMQAKPTTLVVVTNRMADVAGEGVREPFKALAIGPCRMISKEMEQIEARCVDIAVDGTADITPRLVAQLTAEPLVRTQDMVVAYRGQHRWVETLEPARAPAEPLPMQSVPELLGKGRTYLVTGGTNGIGLSVAKFLGAAHQARLVLVARTPLPPRAEWEAWLAGHDPYDAISQRLRGLLEVEQAGGEVMTLSADVACAQSMRAAIATARHRWGHIDGVFHVAGVAGGGLIPLKTREAAARVLAPKLRGALVLEEVLADDPPAFTVLFSSMLSVFAGAGQIDYAAANNFLDAYAAWRQTKGDNVISIDWDMWSEVGMGVGFSARAAGQVAAAAPFHPFDHALLRWSRTEAHGQTYATDLDGAAHWTVGEHLVVGRPTLVGTAYIDMAISAALAGAAGRSVSLSNVFLLAPLVTDAASHRHLELAVGGERGAGGFVFRSRPVSYGEQLPWQDHVMGSLQSVEPPAAPQVVDIAALRARCGIAPYQASAGGDQVEGISFGPRWNNVLEMGGGDGEALALIELGEDFAPDLDGFTLHPAMLDTATSYAMAFGASGFFLPISYKRITVHERLGRRIYSHARFDAAAAADAELATFDISLLDETGRVLVAIEGYALKRVPDSFLQAAATADQESPAASAPAAVARPAELLEEGILTGEGIEAMRRILTRPLGPQVVVSRFNWPDRRARELDRSNAENDLTAAVSKVKPKHKRPKLKTVYVAPRNELEEQVAEVWQGVIGIGQIGVDDGFIELGGNSLLAVQVISRLRDAFHVDLPLEVIYRSPTIAGVTEAILVMLAEAAGDDVLEDLIAEIGEAA